MNNSQTQAAIALGGNQGNVVETFQKALKAINEVPFLKVQTVSRCYATKPMGTRAGDDFINAVALIEADCEPETLLDELHRIETDLGRVRTVHWGPRTIDLDILRFGDIILNTERLNLPHPGCWFRRFVLDPWQEIDAHWIHPVLGESVEQMTLRIQKSPLRYTVSGFSEAESKEIVSDLSQLFSSERIQFLPDEQVAHADMVFTTSNADLPPRAIVLSSLTNPVESISILLAAATDEPTPLTSS